MAALPAADLVLPIPCALIHDHELQRHGTSMLYACVRLHEGHAVRPKLPGAPS